MEKKKKKNVRNAHGGWKTNYAGKYQIFIFMVMLVEDDIQQVFYNFWLLGLYYKELVQGRKKIINGKEKRCQMGVIHPTNSIANTS